MSKYQDFPIDECAAALERIMKNNPTAHFYQKWTCEKCGERVTGNEVDKLFTGGHHEECGHVTNIEKSGCNYAIVIGVGATELERYLSDAILRHTKPEGKA